jgi:hypothetical protein
MVRVQLLNALFPHLAGIHVECVVALDRSVQLEASTTSPDATCPVCRRCSTRVHSRYARRVADRRPGGEGPWPPCLAGANHPPFVNANGR